MPRTRSKNQVTVTRFGKGIPVHARVRRRGQFRRHLIFIQPNAVIAGIGDFVRVRKFGTQSFRGQWLIVVAALERACDWHHEQIAKIGNSGAGQMRMAEAENFRIRIVVTGTTVPTFRRRVRTELHHAKRRGGTRIGMTVPPGSHKHIYIITRLVRSHCARRQQQSSQCNRFHNDSVWERMLGRIFSAPGYNDCLVIRM